MRPTSRNRIAVSGRTLNPDERRPADLGPFPRWAWQHGQVPQQGSRPRADGEESAQSHPADDQIHSLERGH